jgi:hypothetical protein
MECHNNDKPLPPIPYVPDLVVPAWRHHRALSRVRLVQKEKRDKKILPRSWAGWQADMQARWSLCLAPLARPVERP